MFQPFKIVLMGNGTQTTNPPPSQISGITYSCAKLFKEIQGNL